MTFSLLTEQWLRARTSRGPIEAISPLDVLTRDDIVDLTSPRADFRASQYLFLIGLAQTTLAPSGDNAWRKGYESPPSRESVARALDAVSPAFDLDDPRAPFMQESGLVEDAAAEGGSISRLLIDSPRANTEKLNKDLFVKRRREGDALCRACAASALISLQMFAGEGGPGYMTSIRGGGPLSAVIRGPSVRRTIWLNLVRADEWKGIAGGSAHRFPWMDRFDAGRRTWTLDRVHPDVHYWATPRRLLLAWGEGGACTLCAEPDSRRALAVTELPRGASYDGAWKHPLSPHTPLKDGTPNPMKAKGGAGYELWLSLVVGSKEGARPARVVELLPERVTALGDATGERPDFVLWSFGYEMAKAKVEGWIEGRYPVPTVAPGARDAFNDQVTRFVLATRETAYLTKSLTVDTLVGGSESRGNADTISEAVWVATEPAFYRALSDTRRAIEAAASLEVMRSEWLALLHRTALEIYDVRTSGASIAHGNPKRLAENRRKLDLLVRTGKPAQQLGLASVRARKAKVKA